jgi:hypothetical protein
MNKLFCILVGVSVLFTTSHYSGSTVSAVTLAGGIVKAKHVQEVAVKYKRKDCPVCKGKGWYMSGDGILKIDCTYCEADKGQTSQLPPTPAKPNCTTGQCPLPKRS